MQKFVHVECKYVPNAYFCAGYRTSISFNGAIKWKLGEHHFALTSIDLILYKVQENGQDKIC